MIRLVTRGRLSQNYAKGFLAAPEDREPAVRKLIEAAGGKLINFYFAVVPDTDLGAVDCERTVSDSTRIARARGLGRRNDALPHHAASIGLA